MKALVLALMLIPDAGRRETGLRPADVRLLRSLPLAHGRTYAVAFSPDGRRVAAGGDDGTTVVIDTQSWKELFRLKGHEGAVYAVQFSPDGRVLATAGARDATVRLWDVQGVQVRLMRGGPSVVYRLAFSPDGDQLLASGQGDAARVLDVERGDVRASLAGHRGISYGCAFGGTRAATGDSDGVIRVWRSEGWTEERRMTARGGLVYALKFSRDGRRLLSGSGAGELAMWDVETGRALLAFKGLKGDLRGLAFSPDGRHVVTAESGAVRIWDAATGLELRRLEGKTDTSFELAMHPAGLMFAVAGADGRLDLYGR